MTLGPQREVLLQVPLASLQAINGVGAAVPGAQHVLPIFRQHTNASAAPGTAECVVVRAPYSLSAWSLTPNSLHVYDGKTSVRMFPDVLCYLVCSPFEADLACLLQWCR